MSTYELGKRVGKDNTRVENLFFSISSEGILLNANQSFCRILNKEPEMIVGTSMWNIIHEDDCPLFIQRIAESFERNLIPFTFRFANIEEKNQPLYVKSCVYLTINEVCIHAISIVDSTEYTTGEQLLIEDIMNNLEVGISQYDVQKRQFLYFSPAMEKLFGIRFDDLQHDHGIFITNCHVDDITDLLRFYKELSKERQDVEFRILTKNDEIRWVRTTVNPVLDEEGNLLRYFCFTNDISYQKLQEELLQKWDKLKVVGQLSASLAHQIRNPLTTVKGLIQLLESNIDPIYTEIMTKEMETIESIIEEFIQLARPSSSTEFSIASIHEMINRNVSLMEKEVRVHNITLQVFLHDEDAFILCESEQIQQVFMNIIENAIDAMPNGGSIVIRTAVEEDNMVKITIADTGCGMSFERLQRLGEPFYSKREKGTGLGLMVSYKIIEFHNGTIQFSSEEGVGTTVDIRLPTIKTS